MATASRYVVSKTRICSLSIISDSKIAVNEENIGYQWKLQNPVLQDSIASHLNSQTKFENSDGYRYHIENINKIKDEYKKIIIMTLGDNELFDEKYNNLSMAELQEKILDKTEEINTKLNAFIQSIYPITIKFQII